MIYKMDLKDSSDTMTFNLLETPIVDKDIEGAVDNVTLDGNQYTDYLYLKKQYIQKWAIMCPDEYDELRGFYTRQFEDGEVPSYRVYYGANVTRDYTFNGDYLQFNAEGIETGMTLSQLLGNVEQETTTGKNLFGASQGSRTDNNVTNTIKDGVITLNGTTSGAGTIGIANQEIHYTPEGGDTYTFTIWLESGTATFTLPDDCGFYIRKSDGTSYATGAGLVMSKVKQYGYQSTTFTAPSATPMHFLISANKAGTVFNNVVLRVQVEKGSTKTDWEEYTAGASPNPSYPQPISTVTGAQNVKVVGKNLLNDSIIQRTIPSSGNFNATIPMTIKAGTYSFGAFANGVFCPEANYYVFQFRHGSTPIVASSTPSTTMTLTAEEASQVDNMFFYFNANFTGEYGGKHLTAMVCSGNTLGAYEPYQNQSYEVNLGKNLLPPTADWTQTVSGVTITCSNGQYTFSGTATANGSTTARAMVAQYTIQSGDYFHYGNALVSDQINIQIIFTDGTSFVTSMNVANRIVSLESYVGKTIASCRVNFASGNTFNGVAKPMIVHNVSTQTSFAPYFTPIELAKVGNYQDRIYKDDGKWYIEKNVGKLVFDSTNASSIAQSASNPNRYINPSGSTIFTGLALGQPSYQSYCSHYTFVRNGTAWQGIGKCGFDSTGTFWLMDSTTSISTLRAWLASEGVYIYYPLATPTTTEITDETLLLQLNFLASLYEGENNISLVGTWAQGEMEVFIRDVMSVETDVVPEVPVRLTLTDDGVINACGCRRNVQLTMRETTE